MLAKAELVYVASGKKIIEFTPATADKEALLKAVIGPSGNLRAPALRRGATVYIGFHPTMYNELAERK